MDESQEHICVTEARHKSLYTKQSHLYGIQKKANSRDRKQISDRWGLKLEVAYRQHYWVTTVLLLDCADGYMIVYVCKNH